MTTAGAEMDVLGLTYDRDPGNIRAAVVAAFPRTPGFRDKPGSTSGKFSYIVNTGYLRGGSFLPLAKLATRRGRHGQ